MPSLDRVVLGSVCMRCSHDKAANLEKYETYIEDAARQGVQLLVFPEVSVQGYITQWGDTESAAASSSRIWLLDEDSVAVREEREFYMREAEEIPGPVTNRIGRLARQHGMTIQFGMAERSPGGTVMHNSAVLVGPDGLIGVTRKIHSQVEWPIFRPGNHFPVFDTAVGKIGPVICADLLFPETSRILAIQGAEILAMTTAHPMLGSNPVTDYGLRRYRALADATAIMNQVWLIQSNQIGRSPKPGAANYFGHSRIVSPSGDEVAACGYEEALVVSEVPMREEIRRQKRMYQDILERRRPELYGLLTEPSAARASGRVERVLTGN